VLAADEFYFAQRPILGRGRGCAATWKADVNGRAQAIESTFIPEFEFPGVSAALEGFDRFYLRSVNQHHYLILLMMTGLHKKIFIPPSGHNTRNKFR